MLNALQRGVTLVELLIGLAIVGLLLAMGAPSFSSWIQNSQIRTASEAMQNGLQLARAEAVRRNTLISFQLVDNLTSGCLLSVTGKSWVVSLVASPSSITSVASLCDKPPKDPPDLTDPAALPPDASDPYIIQKRDAHEGSPNAVVAADQFQITFNGLGRMTSVVPTINILISNPKGGSCKPAGPMRCMKIQVAPGGQTRMCDPSFASTDPQGCSL